MEDPDGRNDLLEPADLVQLLRGGGKSRKQVSGCDRPGAAPVLPNQNLEVAPSVGGGRGESVQHEGVLEHLLHPLDELIPTMTHEHVVAAAT